MKVEKSESVVVRKKGIDLHTFHIIKSMSVAVLHMWCAWLGPDIDCVLVQDQFSHGNYSMFLPPTTRNGWCIIILGLGDNWR